MNCLSVFVMARAVILAEVYQCCTALNGKQRARPVLYCIMALIKTRLICLWLVLNHRQVPLRDKTVNGAAWMHICYSLPSFSHLYLLKWRFRRALMITKWLDRGLVILWALYRMHGIKKIISQMLKISTLLYRCQKTFLLYSVTSRSWLVLLW